MSYDLICALGKKVLGGGRLTPDEAMSLTALDETDIPILLGVANKVRAQYTGTRVDT
jgi:biotin synthase